MAQHVDVLVVGAGISGISAGYHLQTQCPGKSYAILEGRAAIGGTWDLFRYPGVRSDSDMFTLGYSFQPWTEAKAIADGPAILNYVQRTAKEFGIDKKIQYNIRVVRAAWSSADAQWTVEAERGPQKELIQFTCNFLFMCSGYYNYENGYTPEFAGVADFAGRIVHPQKWTPDIDYAGKQVVVIGSGATAVTLVPEIAKQAAHVVMLQRSPTYVVAQPAADRVADFLRRTLPMKLAYALARWKQVLMGMLFYTLSRKRPDMIKKKLLDGVRAELGADYDVAKHFTPKYNPWDQRLCLVPDSDFFKAIKSGRASVVTEHIDTFTTNGIKLKSGAEIPADLIVTATGLNLQVLGNMALRVDGVPVVMAKTTGYKGMMYSGVPNLAASFGYTNASWTLKADLTCAYVCRLLNHMDKTGTRIATPQLNDPGVAPEPWVDFSSSYFQRSLDAWPKQGSKTPWKLHQNYIRDLLLLRYASVEDSAMHFTRPTAAHQLAAE